MFRKQLSLAFVLLALASLLQGALAWWAIDSASGQVMRGRVASDLLKGHLQLSASKQRLRSWTSQALLTADVDQTEREEHLLAMRTQLDGLEALAKQAAGLEKDPQRASEQLHQRLSDLDVLRRSVLALEQALRSVRPLPQNADAASTWRAINQVFDTLQGQDLRQLVAKAIANEQIEVDRERVAADRALGWLVGGVLLATSGIALVAALLALYFAKALRLPLKNLTDGALALQRGELHHRIQERGASEFSAVARTLNEMAIELSRHREREAEARLHLGQQVQARTAELEHALEALQRADVSRRQLFADISHELRTPTTAIRGEAEIALRGKPKSVDDYQEALRRIVATAAQLGRVIDDLLTMARSDAQTLLLRPEWTVAAEPVQGAVEQLQALALERSVGLRWENGAPSDLRIWCDPSRLLQLLVLLLDNAIRYSHPGGLVRVHTQVDAGHWLVEVRDQGIGIPAHELPQVFERHYRGEEARRHRADGVGLGLPLGRVLAQAHGATLTLGPAEQQGTVALLRLPLKGGLGE